MIAICQIRQQPHYRREAFEQGLRRAGYSLVSSGHVGVREDLLVIWNRYGAFAAMADSWERQGGTVLVCENGYIGKDEEDRQYYAISVHGHNGSGWFPVGAEDRFSKLNINLQEWRTEGEHILVCGQRGIGTTEMASPPNWHDDMARNLRKITDRPVKVRLHPGNHAPAVPLSDDLRNCWACIIWSSGSGVQSLVKGIPVYVDAPHWICECAAVDADEFHAVAPMTDDGARMKEMHRMAWGQRSVVEIESGEPFATIREHLSECPTW